MGKERVILSKQLDDLQHELDTELETLHDLNHGLLEECYKERIILWNHITKLQCLCRSLESELEVLYNSQGVTSDQD